MTIRGFQAATTRGAVPVVAALDDSQRAVLGLPDGESAAVIGAPGTGKTTTMIELVADRVLGRGWTADELVVLTPNRASATRLRDTLAVRLGVATNGPIARTTNSIAFELVQHAATVSGADRPKLLTGGDQDQLIKELLLGHIEEGTGPAWPPILAPEVRQLQGFRTELRELIMRSTEFGVTPDRLRELGARHGHEEWTAAADFVDEYLRVLGSLQHNSLDAAELMAFATAALDPATNDGGIGDKLGRLRLVVVDDLQETTEATIGMLRAFVARGVAVVAFGDPDVATNAFRSGERDALGTLSTRLGLPGLRTFILSTAHRQGTELRALTSAVTDRIGTAAAGRQHAAVAGGPSYEQPVVTVRAATPAREVAAIARLFRQHHLLRGVPFGRMAVVVRTGSLIRPISRALALAEVPTRTLAGGTALRDDQAARALLTVVDVGLGRTELSPALATEIMLGPFGGFDRLALRRLRVALRAEELDGGGNRGSDELLVEALSAPGRFATIDHRIGRNADRIAQTLAATAELAADNGSIEQLLWLVWERSGLAKVWFEQALGTGLTAADANRNLDGVMALFTAARRFAERRPNDGPRLFIDDLLGAEVPEDTLAPQTNDESVLVTTPSGAVGLEFDVVAVAGLQDGVWPNLRIRGSLLYPQDLVAASTGQLVARDDDGASAADDRKQVLGDELRMFALAVSRATTQVILTAVANEDEAASVLFGLVPPGIGEELDATEWHPLSLRGVTGRLRRELVRPRPDIPAAFATADRADAAASLARLARARVPGADPAEWHGLLEPSTTGPLHDLDDPEVTVGVSPSKLEAFEASPLNWFIDVMSGSQSSTAMGIGTIVHWAMETATDPSVEALWAAVESRWSELLFESPWLAEKQRRAVRVLTAGLSEYLTDFRGAGKELVAAEPSFSVVVGRAKLNGKIDRVEKHDDGSIVIVDLKTGRAETNQAKIDANAQLGAYQLAYDHGVLEELPEGHKAGGAKLLYVASGKGGKLYREAVQGPLVGSELDELRARIELAAIGMAAAEFAGVLNLDAYGPGNDPKYRIHLVKAVTA
ncbi:superfamily I DNA/RNA helicase/RecB family exonuclease [Conyzicola lurida]|uniref:DNA 3'-5' helicase n=1 Tax=Conyzicola lurida TaxID=1172621 RepID=A0A841AJ61_9MICO|nr:superfamily I DNA/RNA helicase/RecB family exonuclease [Conyzicola lurida]